MERLIYNFTHPELVNEYNFWDDIPEGRWKWICFLTKNWERGKS